MTEPDFTSDPWLDARLRNVPLPVGFLARLQEIGNAETQQMDRALRNVPLPDGLLDRLRLISRLPQRRVAWRELALAASVLLAVGLGYFGFVSAFLKSGVPVAQQRPAASDEIAENSSPVHRPSLDGSLENDELSTHGQPAVDQVAEDLDLAPNRDTLSPEFDQWATRLEAGDPLGGSAARLVPGPPPILPKVERQTGQNALGARFDGRESLPDLDSVEVRVPRGLTPPRVAGYDLLFQLKYGQHPPVDPAANQELRSVRVPLVTSSASYRRAWRELAEGRLPAAANLRTEEFLAALDYGYPPAEEGTVAVQTSGGPSPLGSEGGSLFQVAVKAGPLPHEAHEATYLTVVLDTSNSMQHSARWEAVQRALEHLRDAMGPADRITLVGYNDDAEVLVDSQGREEAGRLISALQTVQPRRAANLAAGLSLGCSVMPRASEAADAVRRLVVISGGRVDTTKEAAERARGRVAELAKTGVTLQILDLGRDEQASGDLAPWTQAADGRVTRVADPSTLYWNLLEALIGRSPVVAAQTSLRVTFHPEAVAAYRLVGHERNTITGPALAATEVDLRSGESASGLFEVWLKPTGGNIVATIEVSWQKPGYGKSQRLVQSVTRKQFAHSFASSPSTLQAAAVAALTAETLRGSYFAHTTRSLARVIELAKQVSPSMQEQPSFRELADFVQRAERVRTHGGGSLRRGAAADARP